MATEALQQIRVNGATRDVESGTTVTDLLRMLELNPEEVKGIAVAINEEVVRRQDWSERRLDDGDRVEVITARQGG